MDVVVVGPSGRQPFEASTSSNEHIVSYFVLPHIIGQGEDVPVLRNRKVERLMNNMVQLLSQTVLAFS